GLARQFSRAAAPTRQAGSGISRYSDSAVTKGSYIRRISASLSSTPPPASTTTPAAASPARSRASSDAGSRSLAESMGGRPRTSARVEQRDAHLTPRERLVQDGQVADDKREERKADAGLDHHQDAPHSRDRGDVAEAEREERLAAQVEVVGERTTAGDVEAGAK